MVSDDYFEGFRVDEVLSRSSTTTVYRAFQQSLNRTVLIKELRPELSREEDIRRRFEREAQVCARVKHENIVDIYDYSVKSDRTFLVMEFVTGCSLADLIRDHPRPPLELICAVFLQTLRGLAFAHANRVIHRDLKPSNILLSRDGWVKITDFGLSSIEGAAGVEITQPGVVVGTPAYLAPEVIRGGSITPASDIFSLGATFYQFATGEKIFHADHFSDSLKKVLSYNPPRPSQVRSEFPPELDRIILRMLEKQPSKRWSSCEDIITELEKHDFVAQLGDSKRIIRSYLADLHPEDVEAEKLPGAGSRERQRRYSYSKVGIAAALVVIIALALFSYSRRFWMSETVDSKSLAQRGTILVDSLPPDSSSLGSISGSIGTLEEVVPDTLASASGQKPAISLTRQHPAAMEEAPTTLRKSEPRLSDNSSMVAANKTPVSNSDDLLASAQPALVKVRVDPWADVYVDDIFFGKTPFESLGLTPGQHRLAFRHPNFAPIFRDVQANPGESLDVNVNFWDTVGRIIVVIDTWAEVYVDSELVGITPLEDPLIVSLGKHTVTLKNPAFDTWEEVLDFNRGDPPCTLKVDLKSAHGSTFPTRTPADKQSDTANHSVPLQAASNDTLRQ